MRKDFGAKPVTYPQPVYMIGTYDENGNPDVMNAAWGGISNDTEISFCLARTHKTVANLKKTGAFTVSMATEAQLAACDYVGMVSAKKVPDKVAKAGFHVEKSSRVNAPIIAELPMVLECKVKSYDEESERLVGEIVNMSADKSVLTDGKVDPAKLRPLVFDAMNHTYLVATKTVGKAFAHPEAPGEE